MSGVIVAMFCLVCCWRMWAYYRASAKCSYCGGEWMKHQDDCPLGGSGAKL